MEGSLAQAQGKATGLRAVIMYTTHLSCEIQGTLINVYEHPRDMRYEGWNLKLSKHASTECADGICVMNQGRNYVQ